MRRAREGRLLAGLVALAVSYGLLGGCADRAEPPGPLPDVLLVVLDTVRADRLSAYGHRRPTSPTLASLAREGVLFRDVTAPDNWTWPTHASIFTGTPPWVHGARFASSEASEQAGVRFSWGPSATAMRDDLPTLAERFAAAGYRTGFVTANAVVAPELASSLLRGFETAEYVRGDRQLTPWIEQFLGSGDERPVFLCVNVAGAHAPYVTHGHPWVRAEAREVGWADAPEWLAPFGLPRRNGVTFYNPVRPGGRHWAKEILEGRAELPQRLVPLLRALYDSDLAAVDAVLADVLAAWRDGARASVIAVTSDHGEYLGERGLIDHTAFLYPGVLRVPLVLSARGLLPAGRVVDAPVELQDLYGTLVELALTESEPGSLLPLLDGAPPREPIRAEARPRSDAESERLRQGYRSCRWGDEVVIVPVGALHPSEYYDLSLDPGMLRDLAAERPGRAKERAAACRRAFADAVDTGVPVVTIPEDLRAPLRALGYVEDGEGPPPSVAQPSADGAPERGR